MTTLYLITHAHTQTRPDQDARSWHLSASGRRQADALARLSLWTRVDRVLLSSEPKTRLTVESLLTRGRLPVWVEPRFDELRRGGWVGSDYAAFVARALAKPHVSSGEPGGEWEPASEALARFQRGVDEIRQRLPRATLALVGHGLTLSLFRAFLLGQKRVDFTDWQQLSFAAIARVDLQERCLLEDFGPLPGMEVQPRAG